MNLKYTFHSGKNYKFTYFISGYFRLLIPHFILRLRMKYILKKYAHSSDREYIDRRTNYYCRLENYDEAKKKEWMEQFTKLSEQQKIKPKVYFLDSFRYARYFPMAMKWHVCPGDINYNPPVPSIVKSRPINTDGDAFGVLMKLNRVRHFVFLNDSKPWETKLDKVIFRGAIGQKEGNNYKKNRFLFISKYFNHPMCDIGEINSKGCFNPKWVKPKLTLYEHLDYKFIMALEGNDVASNLKWVMSSNSIAVMPKPKYETWFMEGTLIPDYHYIEIKEDFSDLEEKLRYYIAHPEEAKSIISHAHEFVDQFRNRKREEMISLLVLKKYFEATNTK
jgi:hypothetical protein